MENKDEQNKSVLPEPNQRKNRSQLDTTSTNETSKLRTSVPPRSSTAPAERGLDSVGGHDYNASHSDAIKNSFKKGQNKSVSSRADSIKTVGTTSSSRKSIDRTNLRKKTQEWIGKRKAINNVNLDDQSETESELNDPDYEVDEMVDQTQSDDLHFRLTKKRRIRPKRKKTLKFGGPRERDQGEDHQAPLIKSAVEKIIHKLHKPVLPLPKLETPNEKKKKKMNDDHKPVLPLAKLEPPNEKKKKKMNDDHKPVLPLPKLEPPKKKEKKKEKKKKMNDDIFGFRSILLQERDTLFKLDESAERIDFLSEDKTDIRSVKGDSDYHPDMTWLRDLSPSVNQKRKNIRGKSLGSKVFVQDGLYLLWSYLLIGGRMPFVFEKSSDPSNHAVRCEFDRRRRRYHLFLLSSIFLVLLTFTSSTWFLFIFFDTEESQDAFRQTEKLLFDKNWVTGLVFICSLVMSSLTSLSVILDGELMAEYITSWDKILLESGLDMTSRLGFVVGIFIVWTTLQGLSEPIAYLSNTERNAFIEGTHFITVLIFGPFVQKVLLPSNIDQYAIIALLISIYTTYCSRSFLVLIMVYSTGISNLANDWNVRLRFILKHAIPKPNEPILKNIMKKLDYNRMFEQHHEIATLIKNMSSVFSMILLTFYATQGVALAGELLETAIYLVAGQPTVPLLNISRAEVVDYKYEKDGSNEIVIVVHICQTIAIFLVVSLYLSWTGEAAMEGQSHVRRHNHMNLTSTHQRDFVLSLLMSYSDKQPYNLNAGGIFDINKPFIYGFLAGVTFFFSVMIQCNFPRLVSVPIIFGCDAQGTCQLGNIYISKENVMESVLNNLMESKKRLQPTTPTTNARTTMTTTTTTTTSATATATPMSTTTAEPVEFPCRTLPAGTRTLPGGQGLYYTCTGTTVTRYQTFMANGHPIPKQTKTFDCIYNPYPAERGPHYDCFGNLLDEYDGCGVLNFRNTTMSRPIRVEQATHINTPAFGGQFGEHRYSCWNLGNFYYRQRVTNIELNNLTLAWYPCFIPRWFYPTVCINRAQPPKPKTLDDLRMDIKNILATNLSKPACNADKSSYEERISGAKYVVDQVGEALTLNTITKEVNLRYIIKSAPNVYFPFFHPDLLGSYLSTLEYASCPPGGTSKTGELRKIALTFDDCGFLDTTGSGVMNSYTNIDPSQASDVYKCFAPRCGNYSALCPAWRKWYGMNKPVQ